MQEILRRGPYKNIAEDKGLRLPYDERRVKRFAAWAQEDLMRSIKYKLIAITANSEPSGDGLFVSGDDHVGYSSSLRDEIQSKGVDATLHRATYIWFLRLVAVRYMEVHDLLPFHVRMFSSPDGSFNPECLSHPLDMPIGESELFLISRHVQMGNDRAIMRLLFLSLCHELSVVMPYLFEQAGDPYEELLPDDLLRQDGIVSRLVQDVPDNCWREGVEVFGYLFEGYAEGASGKIRRDTKRGYRLDGEEFALMGQTCSAGWPGRFLVDNTLGRLLSEFEKPDVLAGKSVYLLPCERDNNRNIDLQNLAVADFACGSGMLLAYSFDALIAAYTTLGYSLRDAVKHVIEGNLVGFDVDERAVLFAKLVLVFKACSYDRRFIRRGVVPAVILLEPVEFTEDELSVCPRIALCDDMLSSVLKLNECGSLFVPRDGDLAILRQELARLTDEGEPSFIQSTLREKIGHVLRMLEPLSVAYDVVLCDAPRPDAKRMSRWLAKWIVEHFPNDRSFLPAAFIDRTLLAVNQEGYVGVFSSSSLMFSNNASAFRANLFDKASIVCAIETTDGQGLQWGSDAGWVIRAQGGDSVGLYVRLNQFGDEKEVALREAANGKRSELLFYKRSSFFESIPGTPIAYWASEAISGPFSTGVTVSRYAKVRGGISTGNTARFIRQWYELSLYDRGWEYHPFVNGGLWRKWYGNRDQVIRWGNDGEEIKRSYTASSLCLDNHFKPGIVWGNGLAFRLLDSDEFMVGGQGVIFSDPAIRGYLLGMLNCSSFEILYKAANFEFNSAGGEIAGTPATVDADKREAVDRIVSSCVSLSRMDYECQETAWGFARNPIC